MYFLGNNDANLTPLRIFHLSLRTQNVVQERGTWVRCSANARALGNTSDTDVLCTMWLTPLLQCLSFRFSSSSNLLKNVEGRWHVMTLHLEVGGLSFSSGVHQLPYCNLLWLAHFWYSFVGEVVCSWGSSFFESCSVPLSQSSLWAWARLHLTMELKESDRTKGTVLFSHPASTRELSALPGWCWGHQPGGPCGQLHWEPCPLILGVRDVEMGLLSEPTCRHQSVWSAHLLEFPVGHLNLGFPCFCRHLLTALYCLSLGVSH